MLSPALESDLAAARANQTQYTPNEQTLSTLNDKTLIMLVSPVATGKSYVIDRIAAANAEFDKVPIVTTRDQRPGEDPTLFRAIPHDERHVAELLDHIENGELVQYAIHPTSGRIYGTYASDYPGKYNLLATLSGAVEQLRTIPFQRTVVIGLSTDPATWRRRLTDRYPEPSEEKTKRLKEAIVSLQWMLDPAQKDVIQWANNPDNPDAAVKSIIDIVKYNKQGDLAAKENARRMLEIAEDLL